VVSAPPLVLGEPYLRRLEELALLLQLFVRYTQLFLLRLQRLCLSLRFREKRSKPVAEERRSDCDRNRISGPLEEVERAPLRRAQESYLEHALCCAVGHERNHDQVSGDTVEE